MHILKKLVEQKIELSVTANDDVYLIGKMPEALLKEAIEQKQAILDIVKPSVFPVQTNVSAGKTRIIMEGIDIVYITEGGEEIIKSLQGKPLLGLDIETMPKAQYQIKERLVSLKRNGMPKKKQLITDNKAGLSPHTGDVRLIQLFDGSKTVYVFDMLTVSWEIMKPLAEMTLTAHNACFEAEFFLAQGIKLKHIHCSKILSAFFMYARKLDLATVSKKFLQIEVPKDQQVSAWENTTLSSEQIEYAAADAALTFVLTEGFLEALKSPRCYEVCRQAILPVCQAKLTGMVIDKNHHQTLITQWEQEITTLHPVIQQKTGITNPGSFKQIQDYLKTLLSCDEQTDWPKTKKGRLSTKGKHLMNGSFEFPQLTLIAKITKALTRNSNFGQKLIDLIKYETNRIHGNLKIAGAKTGRFTSSEPNLQNMPRPVYVDDKTIENVRKSFIAPEGKLFVCADYSQAELRAMADISGDERMLLAYKDNLDLHKVTASSITGKHMDDINTAERQLAKAVNFGLIFGMGVSGLREYAKDSYGVDMTLYETEQAREQFFNAYPQIKEWQIEQANHSEECGYVETPLGRRHLWQWENGFRYNLALNMPIQGGVAEVALLATARIYDALPPNAILVNQVHDEFLVECAEQDVDQVRQVLETEMIEAFSEVFKKVSTNNLVVAHSGKSWAEAK